MKELSREIEIELIFDILNNLEKTEFEFNPSDIGFQEILYSHPNYILRNTFKLKIKPGGKNDE
jgi:hypothetical protein